MIKESYLKLVWPHLVPLYVVQFHQFFSEVLFHWWPLDRVVQFHELISRAHLCGFSWMLESFMIKESYLNFGLTSFCSPSCCRVSSVFVLGLISYLVSPECLYSFINYFLKGLSYSGFPWMFNIFISHYLDRPSS